MQQNIDPQLLNLLESLSQKLLNKFALEAKKIMAKKPMKKGGKKSRKGC